MYARTSVSTFPTWREPNNDADVEVAQRLVNITLRGDLHPHARVKFTFSLNMIYPENFRLVLVLLDSRGDIAVLINASQLREDRVHVST